MALFKIFKGNSANLGAKGNITEKTKEGNAYFTEDDGKFYIDIATNDVAYVGNNKNELVDGHSVNRICINQRIFNYNDFDILDCGTSEEFDDGSPVVVFDCQA